MHASTTTTLQLVRAVVSRQMQSERDRWHNHRWLNLHANLFVHVLSSLSSGTTNMDVNWECAWWPGALRTYYIIQLFICEGKKIHFDPITARLKPLQFSCIYIYTIVTHIYESLTRAYIEATCHSDKNDMR